SASSVWSCERASSARLRASSPFVLFQSRRALAASYTSFSGRSSSSRWLARVERDLGPARSLLPDDGPPTDERVAGVTAFIDTHMTIPSRIVERLNRSREQGKGFRVYRPARHDHERVCARTANERRSRRLP